MPAPPSAAPSVDWTAYDFLDLGCSAGGSIPYCRSRFRAGRGLGVDVDPTKIAKAKAAGLDALLFDATSLATLPGLGDGGRRVRFVSMLHFLEHLPTAAIAEDVLRSAAAVATDFLFVRHPSFEGEAYLAELGLRQYWWDWKGHKTHLRVVDLCLMLDRLGLHQYAVRYREPVWDSRHRSVLCAAEPPDQPSFDPARHRSRPVLRFAQPLWEGQDIFVALRALPAEEWATLTEAA